VRTGFFVEHPPGVQRPAARGGAVCACQALAAPAHRLRRDPDRCRAQRCSIVSTGVFLL
jgi:hypothetical protein